jgi:signal transduction histidine kinase
MLDLNLETQGGNPLERLEPALRDCLEGLRAHVLSGRGAAHPTGFDKAVRVSTRAGERYLLPHATPVHSGEGTVSGAIVILQDVTRLRRADDLRSNLVTTVADEFRAPLNSLRMAIHVCLERAAGPMTEQQADLLYAARDGCDRLQAMVDELLDLARLQQGQVELHRTRVAPAALIEAAIEAHRVTAEVRHLLLDHDVPPGLASVLADRERIQLVLSNLLAEAMRDTPPGGQITLRAEVMRDEMVRFEVAHLGVESPPGGHDSPAEEAAALKRPSGADIALSFTKQVVKAHGGTIGFEYPPRRGTVVWFTLPVIGA